MESKESEQWVLKIPHSAKSSVLAKILVILVLGGLCGYFYDRQGQIARQRVQELTFERYQARFADYKAELLRQAPPGQPISSLLGLLAISILFGSYELLVMLASFCMGKLMKK